MFKSSKATRELQSNRSFSSLADNAIFGLGDYLKERINDELLDSGIEFCKELRKGKEIWDKGQIKHGELEYYEKYKMLSSSKDDIVKEGFNLDEVPEEAEKIESMLEDIKRNKNLSYSESEIKQAQHFFTAYSMPFWRDTMKTLEEIRSRKGLRLDG